MTTDADAYPITMAPDAREVAARLGLPPVIASAIHDRAHELQQQVQKMTPVDRQLHDASVAYENNRASDDAKAVETLFAPYAANPWVNQVKASGALADPWLRETLLRWAKR
jgi:hypothetical protein